jgi:hypothetical protein
MKLALASRVGAAADMLGPHLDFHLGAGVDVVFLAGAAEAPKRLAQHAAVHVLESGAGVAELVRAAEDAGADWVIESAANEFWWPRGGSLKELLEPVSPRYQSVQALERRFVAVRGRAGPFSERMVHRLVHGRTDRRFVRRAGADAGHLDPIRGWFPIEVLCFPSEGEAADAYDDQALRHGVAHGVLSVDTRVRDTLLALAEGRSPDFAGTDIAEDASFAADLAALAEQDVLELRDRLDELEARLAGLESSFSEVVKRRLRSLRKRT